MEGLRIRYDLTRAPGRRRSTAQAATARRTNRCPMYWVEGTGQGDRIVVTDSTQREGRPSYLQSWSPDDQRRLGNYSSQCPSSPSRHIGCEDRALLLLSNPMEPEINAVTLRIGEGLNHVDSDLKIDPLQDDRRVGDRGSKYPKPIEQVVAWLVTP